jgi:hypothetical protein
LADKGILSLAHKTQQRQRPLHLPSTNDVAATKIIDNTFDGNFGQSTSSLPPPGVKANARAIATASQSRPNSINLPAVQPHSASYGGYCQRFPAAAQLLFW